MHQQACISRSDFYQFFVNDLWFCHIAITSTSLSQNIPIKMLGFFLKDWIEIKKNKNKKNGRTGAESGPTVAKSSLYCLLVHLVSHMFRKTKWTNTNVCILNIGSDNIPQIASTCKHYTNNISFNYYSTLSRARDTVQLSDTSSD